ncbi:MAG: glycosyltransferase [Acidobacteriota bacterium]
MSGRTFGGGGHLIRILHFVAGLGQGGAERQLALLCAGTSRQVAHEIVAARGEGFHGPHFREMGIAVHSLGAPNLYSPAALLGLAARIREWRPCVLHCWLPSMNLMGGLAARLAYPHQPAVIASVRNVDDWKSPWRIAVDRAASGLWDRVLCNSRAGLECSRRQGIPEKKLHWVPNGVVARDRISGAERERIRTDWGVPPGGVLLISACRLVPQKQVHLLLPMVQILKTRFPGLRLLICGDGPLGPALREQTAALGLTAEVSFAGAVDDPWPHLCASDALVMTSQREGTSNTLLEALQAGCAVFATAVGDNRALVGNETGWTGHESEMARALEDALARPDVLARYRAAAGDRAREFSIEKMAVSTLSHYEAVLRRKPARRRAMTAMGPAVESAMRPAIGKGK